MKLAAIHFTPRFGALAENRAGLLAQLESLGDEVDLVVLPELATTGFCLDASSAEAWAEAPDGPTAQALAAWAKATRTHLACGLALREGARLSNAQLLFNDRGELCSIYRKRHLWGHDAGWAQAGDEPGKVTATRIGRIAQLICADLGHLETMIRVARQRPAVLAFSTAWVGAGEPFPTAWQVAVRLLDPAPLVAANRGGSEEGVEFEDPSAILSYRDGGVVGARGLGPEILRWSLAGDREGQ